MLSTNRMVLVKWAENGLRGLGLRGGAGGEQCAESRIGENQERFRLRTKGRSINGKSQLDNFRDLSLVNLERKEEKCKSLRCFPERSPVGLCFCASKIRCGMT